MTWLTADIQLLAITAVTIGFVHTLLGPDHYLPFVALARQRGWRLAKTLRWTAVCGAGHCLSSIALGAIGIGIGLSARRLESLQAARGDGAAWLLLGIGLAVLAVGLRRALRRRPHCHLHVHANGLAHAHPHAHDGAHVHVHEKSPRGPLAWSLFVVFLLGPCEALIPMLMYPAAQANLAGLALVTAAFTLTTLLTMLALVTLSMHTLRRLRFAGGERYAGALTGLTIMGCAGVMLAGL